MTSTGRSWLKAHWFAMAVLPLLLLEWLVMRRFGMEMGPVAESIALFDLCIFMPLLYFLCYGRSLPLKQLVLRMLGLVCLGVYLASYIVPAALQQILPQLEPVRMAGLAVLMLVELRLLILATRVVWKKGANVAEVQAASGAPAWIAKLMLVEARFWQAVWRLIRHR